MVAGPVHADLLSHWRLDGDLLDSGPGGNDGTFGDMAGVPTFVAGYDGTPEGAISLNGSTEYVAVEQSTDLPITAHEDFTIAMWVNGPPPTADARDLRIFCEGSDLTRTPVFTMGTDASGATGGVDIYIRNEANETTYGHRVSAGVAFDNTWHHVAWVDSFGAVTLYIDGEPDPVDFSYARPFLPADLNRTAIGVVLRDTPSHWFPGIIDDVRLYTHALSQVEVEELIAGEPPPLLQFRRGDANRDGGMNIADAVYVLQNIFAQGPDILCADAADANDDENLNIADAVYILQNIFAGGAPIPAPGAAECGPDPTGKPGGGPDLPACDYCPDACQTPASPCPPAAG
jgi:hypothetical protein